MPLYNLLFYIEFILFLCFQSGGLLPIAWQYVAARLQNVTKEIRFQAVIRDNTGAMPGEYLASRRFIYVSIRCVAISEGQRNV